MNFDELISNYGKKELAFEFAKIVGEKITFLVDAHGDDESGDIKYSYFKVEGIFKLHTLNDDNGWSADCQTILSYDIHVVSKKKNVKVYALYEMTGAYIEFSVDNCQIEELSWEEYQHQYKTLIKDKNKKCNIAKSKLKLSEQSVLFIKEIISKDFSQQLPLSYNDFWKLFEYIFENYEVGLLNDDYSGPCSGFEELHSKSVNFITEVSDNEIDIDDLNARLIKS